MKEDNLDMLSKIFECRQYDIEENREEDKIYFEEMLNDIDLNRIYKIIDNVCMQEELIRDNLHELLQKLIENYDMKIAYYSEKYYKQGLIDGMNLQQNYMVKIAKNDKLN